MLGSLGIAKADTILKCHLSTPWLPPAPTLATTDTILKFHLPISWPPPIMAITETLLKLYRATSWLSTPLTRSPCGRVAWSKSHGSCGPRRSTLRCGRLAPAMFTRHLSQEPLTQRPLWEGSLYVVGPLCNSHTTPIRMKGLHEPHGRGMAAAQLQTTHLYMAST